MKPLAKVLRILKWTIIISIPTFLLLYYGSQMTFFFPSSFFYKTCLTLGLIAAIICTFFISRNKPDIISFSIDAMAVQILTFGFLVLLGFIISWVFLFAISEKITVYKGSPYQSAIVVYDIKYEREGGPGRLHRCGGFLKLKLANWRVRSPQLPYTPCFGLPLVDKKDAASIKAINIFGKTTIMGNSIESYSIERNPEKIQNIYKQNGELTRQWEENDF